MPKFSWSIYDWFSIKKKLNIYLDKILEYFRIFLSFCFQGKNFLFIFCIFLKIHTLFIGDHFVTSRLTSHPPLPLSRPFFSSMKYFFATTGPVPCHRWWPQPFLGAGALVCSSALIAFQQRPGSGLLRIPQLWGLSKSPAQAFLFARMFKAREGLQRHRWG